MVTMYLDHFLDLAYPPPKNPDRYAQSAVDVKNFAENNPEKFAEIVRNADPRCMEQYDFDICHGASYCEKLKGHSGAHA